MATSSPIRSVVYRNEVGYRKYPLMASDNKEYRQFLQDIGVGQVFNSRDLSAVPGHELFSKLFPMLSDPELIFYLEYSDTGHTELGTRLYNLGTAYDEAAPQMSSSYIISNKYFLSQRDFIDVSSRWQAEPLLSFIPGCLNELRTNFLVKDYDTGKPDAGSRHNEAIESGISAVMTSLDAAQKRLADITLSEEQRNKVAAEAYDQAAKQVQPDGFSSLVGPAIWHSIKSLLEVVSVFKRSLDLISTSRLQKISQYAAAAAKKSEDANENSKDLKKFAEDYYKQLNLSDADIGALLSKISNNATRASAEANGLKKYGADYFYDDTTYGKPVIDDLDIYVRRLKAYIDNVVKLIKNEGGGNYLGLPYIIRFYPAAVSIAEPLPGVSTVPLSEHSFLQTAVPQGNVMITFIGNIALDTPDTQWRGLYADIFKAIVKYGNPKCKVRAGRYIIDNCYLAQVPDLTNAMNPAGTFNFSLICEHWDSGKFTPVNYVG